MKWQVLKVIVIGFILWRGVVLGEEYVIPPSMPNAPSIDRGDAFCYDVRTFNLLDCKFTYTLSKGTYDGGHTHNSGRPIGGLRFAGDSGGGTDTLSFNSWGGVVKLEYVAPEASGEVKLAITTIPPKDYSCVWGCFEEKTATVGIEGLEPLFGGYYLLKCDIENCIGYGHTDFYRVQSWVNSLFNNIAYSYYQKFTTSQLLVVTDASLRYGGLYDYKNTWAPPHKTHRIGTDIDVRSKNIPENNRSKFEEIVCDNYGSPKLEYPGQDDEHYHLYFSPYKNLGKICEGEIPI